jgi:ubiquinone biosynthesis protein
VFAWFDTTPLAAASIAQVHRARLHDGTEVIVKIRRPGIADTIEADLRLLLRLAALAEAELPTLKPYRPQQLVREFARSLKRELDLAGECRHAERIAANMAPLGLHRHPQGVLAHTRERVNVQDFIDGVPAAIWKLTPEAGFERTLLAQRGAHAVLKMIGRRRLPRRPHPGNVFYLPATALPSSTSA